MIIYELREAEDKWSIEHILKQATDLDKQIFRYAYDKSMSFGLKFDDGDLYMYGKIQDPTVEDFRLLDRLAMRELTGDNARFQVRTHCKKNGPLVMYICNKKLSCGASATTINKVFYGLVPQFKVQLAKAVPLEKVQFPCFAETKYDGVRIAILVHDDTVIFKTRNGNEVNLPKLKAHIQSKAIENTMIDTEVTLKQGLMIERTRVSGMINSAMKGGTIDEFLLVFNVFDVLSIDDFNYGKCRYIYSDRRVFVHSTVAILQSPQFVAAESWLCNNLDDVHSIYAEHIVDGYEGLILKRPHSMYNFKRTADWVKLKETKSADLTCTGITPGTGKYEGMIGALICEGVVDDVIVHVKAGTGLTDLNRNMPYHMYIGKTVEVKYNTIISDGRTGKHSLFLPRFVMIREDKS